VNSALIRVTLLFFFLPFGATPALVHGEICSATRRVRRATSDPRRLRCDGAVCPLRLLVMKPARAATSAETETNHPDPSLLSLFHPLSFFSLLFSSALTRRHGSTCACWVRQLDSDPGVAALFFSLAGAAAAPAFLLGHGEVDSPARWRGDVQTNDDFVSGTVVLYASVSRSAR